MKYEQTVYETLPAGYYNATVSEISEEKGQYGAYVKWRFAVGDDGATVTGISSTKFSTKSKMYGWARAILGGGPVPKSYMLDTEDLEGRSCVLQLGIHTAEDGTEYNQVLAVLPARKADGAASEVTQLPQEQDLEGIPY